MRLQIFSISLAICFALSGCASTKSSLFGSKSKSSDSSNSNIASAKTDSKKSAKQEELEDLLSSRKDAPVAFRGGAGTPSAKKKDPRLENPDQPFGDNSRLASNRSIRDLMRDGAKYESQQKWDLAVESYESVLLNEPQHAEAHHRLAVIADRREDYRLADRHYRVAMQRKPTDANLLSDVGYSHFLRGELDRAEGYLKQAIESDPKHRVAHLNLGLVYGKQNRYNESLAMFQTVASEEEVQRNMATLFPNGPPAGQDTQLAGHRNLASNPAGSNAVNTPSGSSSRNDMMPEWANAPTGSNAAGSNVMSSNATGTNNTGTNAFPADNLPSSNPWALSSPGMNRSPENTTGSHLPASNSQPTSNDFWQGRGSLSDSGNGLPPRTSSAPDTGFGPNLPMANGQSSPQNGSANSGSFESRHPSGMNQGFSQESMAARSLGTPAQTNSAALAAELAMNSGWGNLFPTNSNYGVPTASATPQNSPSVPQLPVMTQQTSWPQAPGEYRDPAASTPAGGNSSQGSHLPAVNHAPNSAGRPNDANPLNQSGTSAAAGVWPTTSVPWSNSTSHQPSPSHWGESSQLAHRPQPNGTMNQPSQSMPQIQAGPSSGSTMGTKSLPEGASAPLFPSVQWASPNSMPWNSTTQASSVQPSDPQTSQVAPASFQQEAAPRGSLPAHSQSHGQSTRSHGNTPEPWPYGPAAGTAQPNVRPTASLNVESRSNSSGNSTSGPPPWPYGQ